MENSAGIAPRRPRTSGVTVDCPVSRTFVYLLGYAVLILGLALAADLLGVPTSWVVAGAVILSGSGLMAVSSRPKD